ncbi:MAG: LUD domain-containing protein [Patescibacteria group bacterium]|nr:LUD domain-containing protein [Patescibacteria group bacterium]
MDKWTTIPTDEVITQVVEKLNTNNFSTVVVETGEQAKKKVLEMMPEGAEVLVNTSITLETIGVMDEIDNSGKYNSVRKKYMALDHKTQADEIRKLRSVQDIALGSVHAVTKSGQLMIASNSGSQLPGEVFAAKQVFFVIGAQKIVSDIQEGEKRIFEHSLPLETVRARKAYGLPDTWNSFPSKILIYNREPVAGRVHVIIVKEVLGY